MNQDKSPALGSKGALIQAVKFTLLSLSAGVIETLSFLILDRWSGLPYMGSHVISIVLSVLWNFTLNRRYTFKSANHIPTAMAKVALFYAFFIPLTAFLGQKAADAGLHHYLIKGVTLILNFVGEFLWWKLVVFRGSENTNAIARGERKI